MHPDLAAVAAHQGGVFLRRQALAHGYTEDEVERRLRTREWVRVRRGAYVESVLLASLDDVGQHLLRVHAFLANSVTPCVLSDVSAALMLGLELWRPQMTAVHVLHPGYSGRREAGISHHDAELPPDEVTKVRGVAVTTPERTAFDLARRLPFPAGVAACDSALRFANVTEASLREIQSRYVNWSGTRRAERAIAASDGRAQNPGESVARTTLARAGFPDAEPQVTIRDRDGAFVAMVDFYLARICTAVEFDGASKYGIEGKDARQQVIDEKRREDRIRDCGIQVVRLMARDFEPIEALRARLEAAAARSHLSAVRCTLQSSPPDLWQPRSSTRPYGQVTRP